MKSKLKWRRGDWMIRGRHSRTQFKVDQDGTRSVLLDAR